MGCLPWGPKESDMTERLSAHTQSGFEQALSPTLLLNSPTLSLLS